MQCRLHQKSAPQTNSKANSRFSIPSAGQSHSLKVSDRRRNTPKSVQIRPDSLCAGLWVPCRIFGAWSGPALGPNPARHRIFVRVWGFGARLASPHRMGNPRFRGYRRPQSGPTPFNNGGGDVPHLSGWVNRSGASEPALSHTKTLADLR